MMIELLTSELLGQALCISLMFSPCVALVIYLPFILLNREITLAGILLSLLVGFSFSFIILFGSVSIPSMGEMIYP